MNAVSSLMMALQHGDSFFPNGGFSFSWGVETLTADGRLRRPEDLAEFLVGQLHGRWAGFDRAVVAAAWRCRDDLAAVRALDHEVEIRTLAAEMRSGSQRIGNSLLSVHEKIGTPKAADYRDMVKREGAHGHSAAVQGLLWGQCGLPEGHAVALSAHSLCVGILSAAIRLGAISHIDAQRMLAVAHAHVDEIAANPIPGIKSLSAFAPEAEIAIMRHESQSARMFAN